MPFTGRRGFQPRTFGPVRTDVYNSPLSENTDSYGHPPYKRENEELEN